MTRLKRNKKSKSKINSNNIEQFKPEYVQFNFSFITGNDKYNLENKSFIHTLLIERITYLSSMDWVQVLALNKKVGIETLDPHVLKRFSVPDKFKSNKREELCNDKFFVFRLKDKGRVVGKMMNKTFYILAIDTTFDLYKH